MCRLVAYAGIPRPLDRMFFGGDHSLYQQSFAPEQMLSGTVNVDGYGVAWFPPPGEPVRLAEARPLWHDEDLRPLLASLSSPVAVAAVRSATPGISTDRAGVAPLVWGTWAFALNGFIRDFRPRIMRTLHGLLPEDLHGELRSVTDTEALFLLTVSHLRTGSDPLEALRRVAEQTKALCDQAGLEAQLNMMVSDGRQVATVRTATGATSNSLYWLAGSGLARDGALIASEPLSPEDDWRPVEHGSGIRIAPGVSPEVIGLT